MKSSSKRYNLASITYLIETKMRALTEEETQTLFAKLANYTGTSLKNLIAPLDNGPNADRYVFRLHQSRCYYVRLSLANLATSISRDKLLSLGTCLGSLSCPN
jgi:60S ribosome subunit biogenesis protein NIP7